VNDCLGENRPVQRVTAYLKTLGITELRKSKRDNHRGFTWRCKGVVNDAVPMNRLLEPGE
jgi:hypothetical protein